jgi:hypothetical protein
MMTMAKKYASLINLRSKNRKWKQKPTIRKFEQTFDHYIAFLILQCTGKGGSAPVCLNT